MLAKYLLEKLSGEVEEVKLYEEEILPLDLNEIEFRDKCARNKDFSDGVFRLAKQFANAETIVLASPYWDLSFPAVVKNYFEKITVNGLTFRYGANGIPQGLCKGKRLFYLTTSGGPIQWNFGYDYITALAKNFYGINEVQCIKVEGLDIYGTDVSKRMEEAKAFISKLHESGLQ